MADPDTTGTRRVLASTSVRANGNPQSLEASTTRDAEDAVRAPIVRTAPREKTMRDAVELETAQSAEALLGLRNAPVLSLRAPTSMGAVDGEKLLPGLNALGACLSPQKRARPVHNLFNVPEPFDRLQPGAATAELERDEAHSASRGAHSFERPRFGQSIGGMPCQGVGEALPSPGPPPSRRPPPPHSPPPEPRINEHAQSNPPYRPTFHAHGPAHARSGGWPIQGSSLAPPILPSLHALSTVADQARAGERPGWQSASSDPSERNGRQAPTPVLSHGSVPKDAGLAPHYSAMVGGSRSVVASANAPLLHEAPYVAGEPAPAWGSNDSYYRYEHSLQSTNPTPLHPSATHNVAVVDHYGYAQSWSGAGSAQEIPQAHPDDAASSHGNSSYYPRHANESRNPSRGTWNMRHDPVSSTTSRDPAIAPACVGHSANEGHRHVDEAAPHGEEYSVPEKGSIQQMCIEPHPHIGPTRQQPHALPPSDVRSTSRRPANARSVDFLVNRDDDDIGQPQGTDCGSVVSQRRPSAPDAARFAIALGSAESARTSACHVQAPPLAPLRRQEAECSEAGSNRMDPAHSMPSAVALLVAAAESHSPSTKRGSTLGRTGDDMPVDATSAAPLAALADLALNSSSPVVAPRLVPTSETSAPQPTSPLSRPNMHSATRTPAEGSEKQQTRTTDSAKQGFPLSDGENKRNEPSISDPQKTVETTPCAGPEPTFAARCASHKSESKGDRRPILAKHTSEGSRVHGDDAQLSSEQEAIVHDDQKRVAPEGSDASSTARGRSTTNPGLGAKTEPSTAVASVRPVAQTESPKGDQVEAAVSTPVVTGSAIATGPAAMVAPPSELSPAQETSPTEEPNRNGRTKEGVKSVPDSTGARANKAVARPKAEHNEFETSGGAVNDEAAQEPAASQVEETRCPCGSTRNSPFMIACDGCNTWQHGKCMGIGRRDTPKSYYCHICRPEEVRVNSIAHPRYRDRGHHRDREKGKGHDALLTQVKPIELRKIVAADLRTRKSNFSSSDVDALFKRYAKLQKSQFPKERQSIIDGLHILVDLPKPQVADRFEEACKSVRYGSPGLRSTSSGVAQDDTTTQGPSPLDAAGRSRGRTAKDSSAATPSIQSVDETRRKRGKSSSAASALAPGKDTLSRSPRLGYASDSSKAQEPNAAESGKGKRTGSKRSRPSSMCSDDNGTDGGGGMSLLALENGQDGPSSRNMSREERKLEQIVKMINKIEEQKGRGKSRKKHRATLPMDSPRMRGADSPVPSAPSADPVPVPTREDDSPVSTNPRLADRGSPDALVEGSGAMRSPRESDDELRSDGSHSKSDLPASHCQDEQTPAKRATERKPSQSEKSHDDSSPTREPESGELGTGTVPRYPARSRRANPIEQQPARVDEDMQSACDGPESGAKAGASSPDAVTGQDNPSFDNGCRNASLGKVQDGLDGKMVSRDCSRGRVRTAREGSSSARSAKSGSIQSASLAKNGDPGKARSHLNGIDPPMKPDTACRVLAPGPSVLGSAMVPACHRSSLEVVQLSEQQNSSWADTPRVRGKKLWAQAEEQRRSAITESEQAPANPRLPVKKSWTRSNRQVADCVLNSGANAGTQPVSTETGYIVSMVVVSERTCLPDFGKRLESSQLSSRACRDDYEGDNGRHSESSLALRAPAEFDGRIRSLLTRSIPEARCHSLRKRLSWAQARISEPPKSRSRAAPVSKASVDSTMDPVRSSKPIDSPILSLRSAPLPASPSRTTATASSRGTGHCVGASTPGGTASDLKADSKPAASVGERVPVSSTKPGSPFANTTLAMTRDTADPACARQERTDKSAVASPSSVDASARPGALDSRPSPQRGSARRQPNAMVRSGSKTADAAGTALARHEANYAESRAVNGTTVPSKGDPTMTLSLPSSVSSANFVRDAGHAKKLPWEEKSSFRSEPGSAPPSTGLHSSPKANYGVTENGVGPKPSGNARKGALAPSDVLHNRLRSFVSDRSSGGDTRSGRGQDGNVGYRVRSPRTPLSSSPPLDQFSGRTARSPSDRPPPPTFGGRTDRGIRKANGISKYPHGSRNSYPPHGTGYTKRWMSYPAHRSSAVKDDHTCGRQADAGHEGAPVSGKPTSGLRAGASSTGAAMAAKGPLSGGPHSATGDRKGNGPQPANGDRKGGGPGSGNPAAATAAWSSYRQRAGWAQNGAESESSMRRPRRGDMYS